MGQTPVRVRGSGQKASTSRVTVRTFDRSVVAGLGGIGVGFTVVPADSLRTAEPQAGPSATPEPTTPGTRTSAATAVTAQPGPVHVEIGVGDFAYSSGGNLVSRLRLARLPGCALTTPNAPACQMPVTVKSSVDLATRTLSADLPAPENTASPDLFVVLAATGNGETGDFRASPLNSSSRWAVGAGTGGFSWSYPIQEVPVPSGKTPGVALGYSSQAVDGMVASENSQPGWTGLGWDTAIPFIERRYIGCAEDGPDGVGLAAFRQSGDLCWAGDHLELSLEGHSTPLVRDRSVPGDVWRPRDDPGWRLERLTGVSNGDNNGEYWQLLSPTGTRYTFGRGTQATSGRATNSVFTVPVFGNNADEPCSAGTAAASWCTQAWRWNVDAVIDAHGNETSYFYSRETNNYARFGTTTTSYVRAGQIADIEYGIRAGAESTNPPARVHFATSLRCTGLAGGGATNCPALTASSTDADYPDVPSAQICDGACPATQNSPTFFTGRMLTSISSQRWAGTAWSDVDVVTFTYRYPQPTDGSDASLWLDSIRRTGQVGGSQALPPVTFEQTELRNRVESGALGLRKVRVGAVVDELGRRIEVTYGTPDGCADGNIPSPATNTQDCFPAWRYAGPGDAGFGWWYKYVVTQVKVVDSSGISPSQTTSYRYVGSPAWHYDDTPATPASKQSWSDWRGYGQVDVAQMSGQTPSRALSLTRNRYFRGMDGDRAANDPQTGEGSRHFSVLDSTGTPVVDDPWLTGLVREVQHFDLNSAGAPANEFDGTVTGYDVVRTTPTTLGSADRKHDAHLVVPVSTSTRQTVTSDPGGALSTRTTTTASTYDVHGQKLTMTTRTPGAGVAGGGSDVRCVRNTYARDAGTVDAGMLGYPYRSRTYAGTCVSPTALIRSADVYYDGSATLGGPVTRGDKTRTATAVTATGPDTVTRTMTAAATYDAYGRQITGRDGNNNLLSTAFTPATGLATSFTKTDALNHTETTTLEPGRAQPVSLRDANGQTTTSRYDPLGRLTEVRQPGQASPAPAGYLFVYSLDTARTAPPKTTTRVLLSGGTYVSSTQFLDSLGQERQTQTVSPASTAAVPKTIVADTRYDERGLRAAQTLPVVTSGTAGNAFVPVSPAAANENRTTYDAVNRPVSVDYVAAGTLKWSTRTTYFGDHTREVPPAGGVARTTWTDLRGRTVRTDDGTGAALVSTATRFTDADQPQTVTDPGGHATTYAYDLAGRTTGARSPDTGSSTATYDGAGNQLTATDALASTVTTDYDALNRPVTRWQGASGSGIRLNSWAYDTVSVPNAVGRPTGQTTYDAGKTYAQTVTGYDARGRETGRAWSFPAGPGLSLIEQKFSVRYGYDDAGNRTSITYPDRVVGLDPETVTTGYDSLGHPNTLAGTRTPLIGSPSTVSYVSATTYTADDKLASRSYVNPLYPITRRYGYETDTQRLGNISTAFGDPIQPGTTLKQDDTYSWDPSGNLAKIVDNAPQLPLIGRPTATCFTRDALSRLTHAWTTEQTGCGDGSSTTTHDGPSGFNQSWTYSPDGNIMSARSLLINRTFSYNDTNHPHAVTTAGADIFGYDGAGQQNTRLKTLTPGVLTYTPLHQLSTVVSGPAITKIVYAADGSRLARLNPDSTASLYIDGQEVLIVAGIAKGIRYYQQDGSVVAQRLVTGALVWQLNDTQGSAQIAVLSGTGIPVRTYYDPYGKVRDLSPQPTTDHGFLGKPHDASTGLDALGDRAYDADLGRFVSPDPLAVQDSAQSANPYAYGANDPVRFSDPTGLYPANDSTSTPSNPFSVTPPPPCGIAAPGVACTISPPAGGNGGIGTGAAVAAAAGLIAVTNPSGTAKAASFDQTVKIVSDFFTKNPWANGQTTVLLADVQLADGRNKTLVFLNASQPKPELLQQLRLANVEVYQADVSNPDNHAERVAQQYKAQVEAQIAAGQRPEGERIQNVSRFGVTNRTCGPECARALSEFSGRPVQVGSRGEPGFSRTGRLLKWLGPLGDAAFTLTTILQFDQTWRDADNGVTRDPITGEITNQPGPAD